MKYKVAFYILLFLYYPSISQANTTFDSLNTVLQKAENDTVKITILFKLTWEHLKSRQSLKKAEMYADSARQICQQINFEAGLAKVEFYKGVIGRLDGNYEKALNHFNQYINFQKAQGDSINIATGLYHVAVIHSFQGHYDKSLDTYYRILRIYEAEEDHYMVATILNSIGIIYKNMQEYNDALATYEQALLIFDSLDAKIDQADCLSNTGTIYSVMENFPKALHYYKKALQIDREIGNEWGIAYQLNNIGNIYSNLGKYEKSLDNHRQALAIRQKLGQKKEIAASYINLGTVKLNLNELDDAINYLREGIMLAGEIGTLPELRDGFLELSKAYAGAGNYRDAYQSQLKYIQVKDSILNEEMTKQISELKTKYETEKKDNEILLLQQKDLVQQAQLQQEKTLRNAFLIGFIFLIIIMFLLIWNHRQKIKAREILARKNDEIHQQRIKDLKRKQKIIAMDSMINGQEKERKRVAQDLHDGLGVLLATVQNQFSMLENAVPVNNKNHLLKKTDEMLTEACQEVRKIAHNMMPGALYKLGLISALQDLCHKTSTAHGFEIEFEHFGFQGRLNDITEVTIYRLVQESLINIVKHARATQVFVQLMQMDENITITIEDDGRGFDVERAMENKGMGLRNFQSRVEYLEGQVKINSEEGKGTSIHIEIPAQLENAKQVS